MQIGGPSVNGDDEGQVDEADEVVDGAQELAGEPVAAAAAEPRRTKPRSAATRVMPTRTCAGCGRKAEQAELVRFVAPDGVLTPGRHAPGRGAYTCTTLSCFERAREQHGFARRSGGRCGSIRSSPASTLEAADGRRPPK